MNNVPMRSTAPINRDNLMSLNEKKVTPPLSYQNLDSLNARVVAAQPTPVPGHQNTQYSAPAQDYQSNQYAQPRQNVPPVQPAPAPIVQDKPVPPLMNTTQKGQKVPLMPSGPVASIKACLGWNVLNPDCDVDVSAFLLNDSGKIIGDDWFVFYGQENSPDSSTRFLNDDGADRELITIDFGKLDPRVSKIVFVLTINEAFEKNLNFSMIKDAYVRILNGSDNSEIVSFKMDEYYENVTSMMIGEVYKYKDSWKFNAVGNGVSKDLAGLCELYGVQVV